MSSEILEIIHRPILSLSYAWIDSLESSAVVPLAGVGSCFRFMSISCLVHHVRIIKKELGIPNAFGVAELGRLDQLPVATLSTEITS